MGELSKERPSTPVFLLRSTTFVVGVDLGQSTDPTAVCVLEWRKGVLDSNSEWERHTRCDLSLRRRRSAWLFATLNVSRLALPIRTWCRR